jgi:hypothetical protein
MYSNLGKEKRKLLYIRERRAARPMAWSNVIQPKFLLVYLRTMVSSVLLMLTFVLSQDP